MKRYQSVRGFTLIEVLISMAFFMIIISSLYPLLGWLITRSKSFENDVEAGLLLQEGMESAYNVLAYDWDPAWAVYPKGEYHPAVLDNEDPATDNWILLPGGQTNLNARYERKILIWPVCRDQNNGQYKISDIYDGTCPTDMLIDINSKIVETKVQWNESGRPKEIKSNLLMTYLGD